MHYWKRLEIETVCLRVCRTRSSATADGPRDALCQSKSYQLVCNCRNRFRPTTNRSIVDWPLAGINVLRISRLHFDICCFKPVAFTTKKNRSRFYFYNIKNTPLDFIIIIIIYSLKIGAGQQGRITGAYSCPQCKIKCRNIKYKRITENTITT